MRAHLEAKEPEEGEGEKEKDTGADDLAKDLESVKVEEKKEEGEGEKKEEE